MENNIPWWVEYRRKQYKSPYSSNTEMILRKSFIECLKEYTKQCSIAGINEMCCPKKCLLERIMWIVLFVTMFGGLCFFLKVIRSDTLTKPLIVTTESTTYPISDIDFPAVAFCSINRISKKALKEYAASVHPYLALHNETVEEVENFCWHYGRLIDNTFNETLLHHKFLEYTVKSDWDTQQVIHIMKQLAPKCEDILVKCSWAGKVVNCSTIFSLRRTIHGHCCAFNYVLEYNSAGKPNKSITKIKKQVVPGVYNGLIVILDPQLEDNAYSLYNMRGFEILLFDPNHFADPSGGRVIHRVAEPNRVGLYEIKSLKQIATSEVRKYPLSVRQCLFHDEKPDKFNYMYSYSACIVSCRIKTIQSLCKCTPYFLPINPSHSPICSLYDLKCLNKYKEKLLYVYPMNTDDTEGLEMEMEDSLFCPDCYPDCELTQHHTKSSKISLLHTSFYNKSYRGHFISNVNMTNKAFIAIFQSTPHGVLNRLDVVYYWFEILSKNFTCVTNTKYKTNGVRIGNIGGFSGMLLGFSIISGVEIVYFMFIRFLQVFFYNCRNYNK